ncbi:MAG: hypothetical protein ACTSU5_09055 [Promethearchaeota archaeon]
MTSLESDVTTGRRCLKCGSQVQFRRIILQGKRVGIWQCRVCRFYVFDESEEEK